MYVQRPISQTVYELVNQIDEKVTYSYLLSIWQYVNGYPTYPPMCLQMSLCLTVIYSNDESKFWIVCSEFLCLISYDLLLTRWPQSTWPPKSHEIARHVEFSWFLMTVSIYRCTLTSIWSPIIQISRSHDRLIYRMEIALHEYIDWLLFHRLSWMSHSMRAVDVWHLLSLTNNVG